MPARVRVGMDHDTSTTTVSPDVDPDDPRKPESPADLTKPSAFYVLRKTAREFSTDQCTDLAAALTYYAVLSLFPALVVVSTNAPGKRSEGGPSHRFRSTPNLRESTTGRVKSINLFNPSIAHQHNHSSEHILRLAVQDGKTIPRPAISFPTGS